MSAPGGPVAAADVAAVRAALAIAQEAREYDEIPVGAVVLSPTGEVIGRGHNLRVVDHDPTAHAEIVALRQAGLAMGSWNLHGCTLAVTLEPCTMCAGAIVAARIARVVFGAWDPKAGAMGSLWDVVRDRRLNHRPEVVGDVLSSECAALLDDFFARRRAKAAAVPTRLATADDAPLLVELTALAVDWRDTGTVSTEFVLATPELAHYASGWGRAGDIGIVALDDAGEPIGAAWARRFTVDDAGYGFLSPNTPEITIAMRRGHRGQGIGSVLLSQLMDVLRADGATFVSLSVEDGNRARQLYHRAGFSFIARNGTADTMVCQLSDPIP